MSLRAARAAPRHLSPSTQRVPLIMSPAAASALTTLAEGSDGGHHSSLSPFLTGFVALGVLLLLLWVATRFNRD
jgi:hypothetical protein